MYSGNNKPIEVWTFQTVNIVPFSLSSNSINTPHENEKRDQETHLKETVEDS